MADREPRVVKVGDRKRHVTIPAGWNLVTAGSCKEYDEFVNLQTFQFEKADETDIGLPFDTFDVLIRRDV